MECMSLHEEMKSVFGMEEKPKVNGLKAVLGGTDSSTRLRVLKEFAYGLSTPSREDRACWEAGLPFRESPRSRLHFSSN
jgi:hypothetical protein